MRRIQDEESEEEQEQEAVEERDAIANELFEGSGDVSTPPQPRIQPQLLIEYKIQIAIVICIQTKNQSGIKFIL